MNQTKSFRARVMAGVAFLDVAKPGWLKKIDTKKLDLKTYNTCVIGEIYGSYFEGISKLKLVEDEANALGFHLSGGKNNAEDYDKLTKVWKAVIAKLRAKK